MYSTLRLGSRLHHLNIIIARALEFPVTSIDYNIG
jgi:hypothetical protein